MEPIATQLLCHPQVRMLSVSQSRSLRQAGDAALVFVGGAVGGLLRVSLADVFVSPAHMFPWVTLGVNLAGAFLLGTLVGSTRTEQHRRIRLLLGVGVLGSFTTYSTFAVEVHTLLMPGEGARALAYLAATLTGALLAAHLGLRVSRSHRTCPARPDAED